MARILVIDDEPLVAEMIRRTLEDAYRVAVAHSARAALARLDGGEEFDALVSDLHMPDLDGIGLHEAIVDRHPRLAKKMLFLSGGATTPEARAFLARDGLRCLEKPFRPEELAKVLDELIGGA